MKNLNETSVFSILLIENNQDEQKHFTDIVKSTYGASKIDIFENSLDAIQWLQNNNCDILVIDEGSQPLDASQTIAYLRQELNIDVPVFISSSEDKEQEDQKYIKKPFTEKSFTASFSNFSHQPVLENEGRLYSLSYLENVAGGNTEFIIESIEIFKSSVKKQIHELEIASGNDNYRRAGEIAHNIKPSFEMIENTEGTEICNKLTYELENYSLPELIENLKLVFEKIVQQLETDLAPKKI